jgi:glycosyltransferase involved in cell wall biosynthesis
MASIHGNLLVLTSSYPKAANEPSSIFIHHLAKALREEGWEIIVLAPNFFGGPRHEVMEGIEVVRFNYFIPHWQKLCYGSGIITNLRRNPLLWLQSPLFVLSMYLQAARLLRSRPIRLIHSHWIVPQGIVAGLLRRSFKIPVLLTVHGGDAFAFGNWLGRFFKRLSLRGADACTVNSSYTLNAIKKLYEHIPGHVIPMGVDVETFSAGAQPDALRQQLAVTGRMILFVGRLVEKKGLLHLIQAMPRVLGHFPDAVLVIIGEGASRPTMEQLSKSLGIASSLRFLGRLPNQALPQYYRAADVFVGPSIVDPGGDTEGLGIVFLEAAAAGVPIIGTAIGGSADILVNGITGIVVPPADPVQLAAAIIRALEDPESRKQLAENAKNLVQNQFSWRQVARQFSALFQTLLRK